MKRMLLVVAPLAIPGCSVPPPVVVAPQPVAATRWEGAATDPTAQPIRDDFWRQFGSDLLPQVVADAVRDNSTIEVARARVLRARAEAGLARAALLPTIGVTTGLTQTRTDGFNTSQYTNSAGQIGIDIAYDVDLFGRARAGRRAAIARAEAARLDAVATRLVVATEAARTFIAIAATDDRLALTARLLGNAQSFARIIAIRRREGVAAEVDERLQMVEVGRLEARRADLVQARRTLVGALAVLLGREAADFTLPTLKLAALRAPAVDPGPPGDLMFRRPDVAAAEARIAAANGDVRAARAAFLPSLSLSASAIGQALATTGPFGLTLSAGQSLFAPIFQGGRLRASYAGARADQLAALADYRQRLLQAMQEGSAALAATQGSAGQERALSAAAAAARRAVALARERYRSGQGDLSIILDAERAEIAVEESLLDARAASRTAAVDVYKALGGAPG